MAKNSRQAINAQTGRKCRIPMYIIFEVGMPKVCNDFSMALDKAKEITAKFYNKDMEVRIFDTLIGKFVGTYKNGKLVR